MNVYDFDGSLYHGAVVREFYGFCLRRHLELLCLLPGQIGTLLVCWFGTQGTDAFWLKLYTGLYRLPDIGLLVAAFWNDDRLSRLDQACLAACKPTDCLLSTVPDFLLAPVEQRFHLRIHGAQTDEKGRRCVRVNRSVEERLETLRNLPGGAHMQLFCGARLQDHPLAMEAESRLLVRRGRREDWDLYVRREGRRWGWLRHWLSPEFFRFWCVGWLNMAAAWLLEVGWALVLPKNLAFAVGYAMSLMVSFTLNSIITFRRRMTLFRLGKYVLSYLPNFAVQFLTVIVLHNLLNWPYLLTCFLAAVVGTPVTFLCLKFFAFAQHHHE